MVAVVVVAVVVVALVVVTVVAVLCDPSAAESVAAKTKGINHNSELKYSLAIFCRNSPDESLSIELHRVEYYLSWLKNRPQQE